MLQRGLNHERHSAKTRKMMVAIGVLAVVLLVLPFLAGVLGQAWCAFPQLVLLYVMLALRANVVVSVAGLPTSVMSFYAVGALLVVTCLPLPFRLLLPLRSGLAGSDLPGIQAAR